MSDSILDHRTDFTSAILGARRTVMVYQPRGYRRDSRRQYPLLIIHDGQNVFDGATSYVPGQYWRMREAADELIAARQIDPLVIAAIYHAGEHRVWEYTPTKGGRLGGGGVNEHAHMLVGELLPWLRSRYRLLPHPRHTGLGGSSLGGLAAMWVGLDHPDVFGKLAVMSPSVWWGNRALLRKLPEIHFPQRQRIWLDVGTQEGNPAFTSLRDVRLLKAMLVSKGWREGRTLHYEEADGADHSERAWAARTPDMLRFLYPRKAVRADRS
jgi:predicted alpha/beta superfamily hydrolase